MTLTTTPPLITLDTWLDDATRLEWAERIYRDPPSLLARGTGHYRTGDAYYCHAVFPDVMDLLPKVRETASRLFDKEVLASPFERSEVSVNMYGGGDHHPLHLDSNPLTALLVLCGEEPGCQTVIADDASGANQRPILVSNGGVTFFHGGSMWHGAVVSRERLPYPRITIPFNLYLPGDVNRPLGQDQQVYGY